MIAMVARNSKTVIVLISSVNLSPLLLPAGIALISENIVMAYIIYVGGDKCFSNLHVNYVHALFVIINFKQ